MGIGLTKCLSLDLLLNALNWDPNTAISFLLPASWETFHSFPVHRSFSFLDPNAPFPLLAISNPGADLEHHNQGKHFWMI